MPEKKSHGTRIRGGFGLTVAHDLHNRNLPGEKRSRFLKVLITTSGVGERLGDYTTFTNKSLVPVGDKPAISRIIDSYPATTEFVVTVGYFGEQVIDFVEIAYPERSIQCVPVDNYNGPGSSLAYSISCSEKFLQCPFVYNAGDTICSFSESVSPDKNWLAGFKGQDSNLYASFETAGAKVSKIHPKRAEEFDFLYVGVAGIGDYVQFWRNLQLVLSSNLNQSEPNDLSAFNRMMDNGIFFGHKVADAWWDVGSVPELQKAQTHFGTRLPTLAKRDQSVFLVGEAVIKFSFDVAACARRVERGKLLEPNVPTITKHKRNWFSYPYTPGKVASTYASPTVIRNLLEWGQESFWGKEAPRMGLSAFSGACNDFYVTKSLMRLKDFLDISGIQDNEQLINGERVPPAEFLIRKLADSPFLHGKPGLFHGDFVLDNIISDEGVFTAIDWREGFSNLDTVGDIYYDLAKLNHSLTMNHDSLNLSQFDVSYLEAGVWVDILRKQSLVDAEIVVEDFCRKNGYDFERVKVLTPLIWLNMAPLHPHAMGIFLYYYGRLALWKSLKNIILSDSEEFNAAPLPKKKT